MYLSSLRAPSQVSGSLREGHAEWWLNIHNQYSQLSKACSTVADQAKQIATRITSDSAFVPPARKLPVFPEWRVQRLTGRTRRRKGEPAK
jgi:hypothetical protein